MLLPTHHALVVDVNRAVCAAKEIHLERAGATCGGGCRGKAMPGDWSEQRTECHRARLVWSGQPCWPGLPTTEQQRSVRPPPAAAQNKSISKPRTAFPRTRRGRVVQAVATGEACVANRVAETKGGRQPGAGVGDRRRRGVAHRGPRNGGDRGGTRGPDAGRLLGGVCLGKGLPAGPEGGQAVDALGGVTAGVGGVDGGGGGGRRERGKGQQGGNEADQQQQSRLGAPVRARGGGGGRGGILTLSAGPVPPGCDGVSWCCGVGWEREERGGGAFVMSASVK